MTPEECGFREFSIVPVCPTGTTPSSNNQGDNYDEPCYCYPDNLSCTVHGPYSDIVICCDKDESVASNNLTAICCSKNTTPCTKGFFLTCCNSNEVCTKGGCTTKPKDQVEGKKHGTN